MCTKLATKSKLKITPLKIRQYGLQRVSPCSAENDKGTVCIKLEKVSDA